MTKKYVTMFSADLLFRTRFWSVSFYLISFSHVLTDWKTYWILIVENVKSHVDQVSANMIFQS